MNKKIIFAITIIGIIGLVILMFVLISAKTQAPKQSTDQSKPVESTMAEQQTANVSPKPTESTNDSANKATYVAYNADQVASDKNNKILFFYAPWCPQCRQLDSDIAKNISSDKGVTIYKVDYDSSQDLRKKYGVTLQTTLVKIDDSGNLVKKYVAYQEPTYANVKANLY